MPRSTKGCAASSADARARSRRTLSARRQRAPPARRSACCSESFYRLENWVHAQLASRARSGRPTTKPKPSGGATLSMRGDRSPTSQTIDRTVAAARDEAITLGRALRGRRALRGQRRAVRRRRLPAHDAVRRTQSVVLTSATIATGGSFAFLRTIARRRRGAGVRRAVAVRLSRAGAALRRAAATQPESARISRGAPRRSSRSASTVRAAARSCCSRRTRGCAKSTRCCASGCRFPSSCRANCRARSCSTGSGATSNAVLFAHGDVLGRHRRRRRSALVRHHRPAAVSVAGRSARRGAPRGDRGARRSGRSRST